ncbi:MAG: HD domain-containing protein [Gemmataceae bacterium]|nr:HD domain-containing protein [Gemmataceae bacterium]
MSSCVFRTAFSGADAMTDTKELLQKIAALRTRLSEPAVPATADPVRAIEAKVERGSLHNAMLESALRHADPSPVQAALASFRLTARGIRLLRQGREMLQSLRTIADDAEFQQADEADAIALWHREGMAMIEVILRTIQAMPASVSAQLRMCDGLEVVLAEVEERVSRLHSNLAQRKHQAARIDELADYLRALASKQPVSLTPLQGLADLILDEARGAQPLRFLYAAPTDPSRFAAAHSLTVAQVLARLIFDCSEWQAQAQLAVMVALVHDVGMTRVPADLLLTEGPLDSEQRRLIEKHVVIAEAMLLPLWPGGGWTIEAAACHHERNDGTGYPLGQQEIHLAPFVQLLAVCDVYAALCTQRPHRPAFDTRTALTETLLLAERDYLHKPSAERLLLLSFYPVGSMVELNDGAVARVIATHPGEIGLTHPDRPIVHLIADAQGQAIEWPIVLDLCEQKDRSIVRGLKAEERQAMLGKRHPQWM